MWLRCSSTLQKKTLEVFSTQTTEAFQSFSTLLLLLHVMASVYPLRHLWLYFMKQEMALKSRNATEDVESVLGAVWKPVE